MPQNLSSRTALTATLAATDLTTITLTGGPDDSAILTNNGPGAIWFSFDSTIAASVAGVNCYGLKSGQSLTLPRIRRGSTNIFTCMADTASTILTILCLPVT